MYPIVLQELAYDPDFFNYKGKQVPSLHYVQQLDGGEWSVITKGFHMDSGATVVVGGAGTYIRLVWNYIKR